MQFYKKVLRFSGYAIGFLIIAIIIISTIFFFYKDKIWSQIKQEISISLKSKIVAENIGLSFPEHFPNLSLKITAFKIIDSLTKSEVIHIGNLKADIDLVSFITFRPKIYSLLLEDAKLNLKADALGQFNLSILNVPSQKSEKEDSDSKPISLHFNIPFQKVVLRNVSFQFFDSVHYQHYSLKVLNSLLLIKQKNDETKISFEGNVFCDKLGINTKYGTFLKKKMVETHFFAYIPKEENKLYFSPSHVVIDSERYEVNGYFKPAKLPDIQLVISTDHAVVSKVLESISELVAAQIEPFHVTNPVHAIITIAGPITPNQDPKIDLRFWSKNNAFKYQDLPIVVKNINFEGIVCNYLDPLKPPGDPNTNFEIKDVTGKIGFSDLNSHVNIYNLVKPSIDVSTNIEMNLAQLKDSIPNSPFENLKGKVRLKFNYKGAIPAGKELSLVSNWRYEGDLELDSIGFKTGGIWYENIQGKMKIKNDTLTLPKGFGFQIGGNQVFMSGFFIKPIQHFLIPDTLLKGYLNISSPFFNINTLLVKSPESKQKVNSKKTLNTINTALQNIRFIIELNFKKAIFRKLAIENLKGQFYRYGNVLKLNNLKLRTSGGKMSINIEANETDYRNQTISSSIKIENLDVTKLFYGMNNFDQKTIESHHLEGKLNAEILFSSKFTNGYDIIPNSMKGNLNFKLSHGYLKNFEPIERISKFIFLNRDFSNISFDEITQKATLNGKILEISDMKIQSNVITLFVNGTYNFDNQVDLKIRIPWFNLKNKNHYMAALEKDQTHAKALHIKAFTKKGKLIFGLGK